VLLVLGEPRSEQFSFMPPIETYLMARGNLHDYHFFFAMAIDSYKMLPLTSCRMDGPDSAVFELLLGS